MGVVQATLFGAVQGLTEFLPISSSGHLVIFQQLMRINPPGVTLEVVAHLGTIAAVVSAFADDVYAILAALFSSPLRFFAGRASPKTLWANPDFRLGVMIVAGSIPTAVIGLAFRKSFENLFDSLSAVGLALILTAGLLFAAERTRRGNRRINRITASDALLVGIFQGLAIAPGISRSGATIAAALFRGIERESAARFSLLLSLPAVLGASLLELGGNGIPQSTGTPFPSLAVTFLSSLVFGYIAIKWLLSTLKKGRLYGFSLYCFLLGALAVTAAFTNSLT